MDRDTALVIIDSLNKLARTEKGTSDNVRCGILAKAILRLSESTNCLVQELIEAMTK